MAVSITPGIGRRIKSKILVMNEMIGILIVLLMLPIMAMAEPGKDSLPFWECTNSHGEKYFRYAPCDMTDQQANQFTKESKLVHKYKTAQDNLERTIRDEVHKLENLIREKEEGLKNYPKCIENCSLGYSSCSGLRPGFINPRIDGCFIQELKCKARCRDKYCKTCEVKYE
ncbi:MAG: hypothetical protein HQL58_10620 [Magnetococcales bacterium]|nr:hypothetical protein [Magnetococcales bacterium]